MSSLLAEWKARNFVDDEGCSHGDAEGYMSHVLGFCGCGPCYANFQYIRDGLKLISQEQPEDRTLFKEWYAKWTAQSDAFHGNDQSRYFFYYWADSMGFTEHGGSIPGWLTDYGRDIIDTLTELLEELGME